MSADVGSLAWGRACGGVLTAHERRALRRKIVRVSGAYVGSRVLLALHRRGTAQADRTVLAMPDTPLARAVHAAAAAQGAAVLGHAYRTLAFAHAVAADDGIEVDAELLWCACLLHDLALESPETDRCFAVRGGERAERIALDAGAGAEDAYAIGDAICRHITPALTASEHPLGGLVAAGALIDVLGLGLHRLAPTFVEETLAAHPRRDFARTVQRCWVQESRAVPGGRAALVERASRISLLARAAPL